MITVVGAKANARQSETRTLGDLLYVKDAKPRVSENDWIGLIRSIAAGNEVALHSLYEQTHRIVFTLMLRITNSRQTAEELTVDLFFDVWRKASLYDPANGPVIGWLMNQARCRAIDRVRFERRKKRFSKPVDGAVLTTARDDPQHACQLQERGRVLRNALKSLTSEERRVIETAFFPELTYAEVAKKLNQPIGTVKTRIRSGLGKLRQALAGRLDAE